MRTTTALGHVVPIEDWRSYHADTVLYYLSYAREPFPCSTFRRMTGLKAKDFAALLKGDRLKGLVRKRPGDAVEITPKGRERVQSSPVSRER